MINKIFWTFHGNLPSRMLQMQLNDLTNGPCPAHLKLLAVTAGPVQLKFWDTRFMAKTSIIYSRPSYFNQNWDPQYQITPSNVFLIANLSLYSK